MCRTGGRRCPSHTDPTKIALRNARRREQYFTRKAQELNTSTSHHTQPVLTLRQQEFFKNTKASDNGTPIPLYHGSSHEFTSFNTDTLGRGNDAWGNGFYFTDQKTTAEGYAQDNPSPTANVKEFYLNLTNPLYVDGIENMSLVNVTFPAETAARLLKHHPDLYIQPDNESKMNFLGDYAENFWDKEYHTKEELNRMAEKVAEEYFDNASWVELETVFGKEHGAAFLEAMYKETGNDGLIVDFGEAGKHYVAWFPNQMKLTSNMEPEQSDFF